MADERPNVVVQYVTKTDTTPPPSVAEIILSLFLLICISVALGWWR